MSNVYEFDTEFAMPISAKVSDIKSEAVRRGWEHFRISFDKKLETVIVTRQSRAQFEAEIEMLSTFI